MKIVLWTQSPPKVKAIQQAIDNIVYFKNEQIEVIPLKVSSDISDMPISIEENMLGAYNRAYNAKKQISDADFYVWMEWWTTMIQDKAYLFGVVYLLDKNENWHYGFSNMMEVPEYFRKKIYNEGLELGPVLAQATKEENASKKWWAFAHWSDDMITRTDQFVLAFTSAIVAFYNKYYKI